MKGANRKDKIVVAVVALMLTITGCGGRRQSNDAQASLFDSLYATAYNFPDDTTQNIIDSLATVGKINTTMTDYLHGFINDRQRHIQRAETFYGKANILLCSLRGARAATARIFP